VGSRVGRVIGPQPLGPLEQLPALTIPAFTIQASFAGPCARCVEGTFHLQASGLCHASKRRAALCGEFAGGVGGWQRRAARTSPNAAVQRAGVELLTGVLPHLTCGQGGSKRGTCARKALYKQQKSPCKAGNLDHSNYLLPRRCGTGIERGEAHRARWKTVRPRTRAAAAAMARPCVIRALPALKTSRRRAVHASQVRRRAPRRA
jgi:hypothetical protein